MEKKEINSIVSLLPDEILQEAACRYVFELCREGDLEKSETLFFRLYERGLRHACLFESAVFLIQAHLARRQLERALHLYEFMPQCDAIRIAKLESCNLLVHALLENQLERAFSLWENFGQCELGPAQKWNWAQTGLALLEQCCKADYGRLARRVYGLLCAYGQCELTKGFLERARKLMDSAK